MTYHYLDCGLDNVWLLDGYEVHDTPYGEGTSIADVAGLQLRIGKMIIECASPLNGAEFRFLREELELGQRELALEIGATEQTLRLWEKHRDKPVPGTADRLMRALYREHIDGKVEVRRMLDRLARAGAPARQDIVLTRAGRSWRLSAKTPVAA